MAATLFFARNFDTELADERAQAAAGPCRAITPAELAAAVDQARTEGFAAGLAEGHAAGRAEAGAEIAAATLESLTRLEPALERFLAAMSEHRRALEADLTAYALGLCETLFPQWLAELGPAAMADRAGALIHRLAGTGRLTLTVAPEVAADLARLPSLARAVDAHGAVTLAADPGLAPGAARLDWTDGTARIDPEGLAAAILAELRASAARLTPPVSE